MRQRLCARRRDGHQERPFTNQFHLAWRRFDDDRAIAVFGMEFLPRRQARGISYRLWNDQPSGGIDGSSHAIILPFQMEATV
jgi:hypothetical protein